MNKAKDDKYNYLVIKDYDRLGPDATFLSTEIRKKYVVSKGTVVRWYGSCKTQFVVINRCFLPDGCEIWIPASHLVQLTETAKVIYL